MAMAGIDPDDDPYPWEPTHRDVLKAQRSVRQVATATMSSEFARIVAPIIKDIRHSILDPGRSASFDRLRELAIHTADIEAHCCDLKQLVARAADRDGRLVVCSLPSSPDVPVSAPIIELARSGRQSFPFPTRSIPIDDAVDGFASELENFVVQRLIGQFYFPRLDALVGGLGGSGSGGGSLLPVNVFSSQTSGARVEYSPVYYLAFIVFSAPTSPARGVMAPGRYIFKLVTASNDLYDRGKYDLPPCFNINLMV